MSVPAEISDPDLRKTWQQVKKSAEAKAKSKKQEKPYKELDKLFNLDLGPSLSKWPNSYPDIGAMRTKKGQIEVTITKYEKFCKDAKSKLDKSVLSILTDGLTDAREQLDLRLTIAISLLEGDEDLQLKQAIKASKNPLKPVTVFKHPDLSAEIMKMAPKAQEFVEINELEIEAILSDDKVLGKVDDANGDMGQKVRDAGDFAKLKKDIATAYVKAAAIVKADDKKFNAANAQFEQAVEQAIQDACSRASAELHRLANVKADYRNYKIKSGVKLGLVAAGTVAGGISLALAPFTGPAMAVSALGVIKGAVETGKQIGLLSLDAEGLIKRVASNLYDLEKQYKGAVGSTIGVSEVSVTLVNTIAPTFFSTIKSVGGECDQIGDKINGLEVKAGDLSVTLNKTLDAQKKVQKEVAFWVNQNKAHFNATLAGYIKQLLGQVKANETHVASLIDEVSGLNERIKKARADHGVLAKAIGELSAREPTAAKWAEVFIEVSGSVGFLASANVGWPPAYDIAASTKTVTDLIGNISGSVDGAIGLAENVKGEVDNMLK